MQQGGRVGQGCAVTQGHDDSCNGGGRGGLGCSKGRAGMGNHKRGGWGGLMVSAENGDVAKGTPAYRGMVGRWSHCMASLTGHIGYNAAVPLH